MPRSPRHRGYCFTTNNWTNQHIANLHVLEAPTTDYIVYGKEVGESGTPHLQGFIYFSNPRALRGIARLIPESHIESMRGTPAQAAEYCKKGDDVYEWGTLPEQGARTDLVALIDELKTTHQGNVTALCVANPQKTARYYRFFDRIRFALLKPRTWQMQINWHWGPTGSGKTFAAHSTHPGLYVKNMSTRFWDNYNGEEAILLDDLREDSFPFAYLLRLFDRYPMPLDVKCSSTQMRSKVIYVTAPVAPQYLFPGTQVGELNQLLRRITTIREFEPRPEDN